MLIALFTDPARALMDAVRAEAPPSIILGKATADKMPRMTMTTISSISVKPREGRTFAGALLFGYWRITKIYKK